MPDCSTFDRSEVWIHWRRL